MDWGNWMKGKQVNGAVQKNSNKASTNKPIKNTTTTLPAESKEIDVVRRLKEPGEVQNLIKKMIGLISGTQETIEQELTKAFELSLEYYEEQQRKEPGCTPDLFLSTLSDILHVTKDSLAAMLDECGFSIELRQTESQAPVQNAKVSHPAKTKAAIASIEKSLPDYSFSAHSVSTHPLFGNQYLSCYPIEKEPKVDIYQRFSKQFVLPEKTSTFARPILDIEFHETAGACVRFYLALPARPRNAKDGFKDKDITQEEKGDVEFSYVNLMGFDPLRAFTWVEDYLKNSFEHGKIEKSKPIIRSFLVPIAEYAKLTNSNKLLMVDPERAPGQVKFVPHGSYLQTQDVRPVPGSLVSFTDDPSPTQKDGKVFPLNVLGATLLGEPLHPVDITGSKHIAHQHARELTDLSKKKYMVPNPHEVIAHRTYERTLSGFSLAPKNAINPLESFMKDIPAETTKLAFFDAKKPARRQQQANQALEQKLVEPSTPQKPKATPATATATATAATATVTSQPKPVDPVEALEKQTAKLLVSHHLLANHKGRKGSHAPQPVPGQTKVQTEGIKAAAH